MILIRPVRSQYIDKHGFGRHLKPDIRHGAWFVRGTRESLAYMRKYTDELADETDLPAALVELVNNYRVPEVYLSPADMRRYDYPVPEIPKSGWRRWWYLFTRDGGGFR